MSRRKNVHTVQTARIGDIKESILDVYKYRIQNFKERFPQNLTAYENLSQF